MGIFPIWGFQMITAAFLAHIFKLNKVITLLASNISIAPLMPFILLGSYYIGSLVLGENHQINFDQVPTFQTLNESLLQYIIGSVCLATISAIVFGLLAFYLLEFFNKLRTIKTT